MNYLFHIIVIIEIYVILALSLNLLVGFTGLPVLCHAAFYCIGAYTSALVSLNLCLSPWVGLVAGACLAALCGLVIAYFSIPFRGDYFALVTFGFSVIVHSIAQNWVSVTRGPRGLPKIPQFSIWHDESFAIWQIIILTGILDLLTVCVIKNIVGSPFGRVLRAIREDELAVQALGKNPNKYKMIVFIISAFFAGISGSIYSHYITFIDPSSFTPTESISILLMIILGGLGSIKGSLVGASVLVVLPELLRFLGMSYAISSIFRQMTYGFLLIVLMLRKPQGLMGIYKFK